MPFFKISSYMLVTFQEPLVLGVRMAEHINWQSIKNLQ
uniref:Uncharacterized protein n=1 Tax=Anguilla anguilla TaxID=7936 RepID=A0A0E9RVE8_ANGAN